MSIKVKNKKIVKNKDKKHLLEIVQEDFPAFKDKNINCKIANGWDNIVLEINDKYIFRFPRNNNIDLDKEIKILKLLDKKISLKIPKIEYIGKKYKYIGYKKIKGKKITEKKFRSLTDAEKQKFSSDIARFLHEFHTAFSGDIKKINIKHENYNSYYKLIEKNLINKLDSKNIILFIENTLKQFSSMAQTNHIYDKVVLYNDLHPGNMAFDYKHNILNGIFDFGDVMIGDVNKDFYPLVGYGKKFLNDIVKKYNKLNNRKLNIDRIIIYDKINTLSDLAEVVNNPKCPLYTELLKRVSKWSSDLSN